MIWIILIAVYLVSAYLQWLHTHLAHSKNGIWECTDPDSIWIIIIFIPIINTIFCMIGWLLFFPIENYEGEDDDKCINYNKFFKIKK